MNLPQVKLAILMITASHTSLMVTAAFSPPAQRPSVLIPAEDDAVSVTSSSLSWRSKAPHWRNGLRRHRQRRRSRENDFASRLGSIGRNQYDGSTNRVDQMAMEGEEREAANKVSSLPISAGCVDDLAGATSSTTTVAIDTVTNEFHSCAYVKNSNSNVNNNSGSIQQRRKFLHGLAVASITTAAFTSPTEKNKSICSSMSFPLCEIAPSLVDAANAFEKTFPMELTSLEGIDNDNTHRRYQHSNRSDDQNRKLRNGNLMHQPENFRFGGIPSTSLWALALWWISGSRSNPIILPLANVLYSNAKSIRNNDNDSNIVIQENTFNNDNDEDCTEQEREWLQDRNQGFSSNLPFEFTLLLTLVFLSIGVVMDRTVTYLAEGDYDTSLQLGALSVLVGAFWEVGRVATGEKGKTKKEWEREDLLQKEFEEFASRRLVVLGRTPTSTSSSRSSAHRSEIIAAFRRFNSKYRTATNEKYPLSDVEIERILRRWNKEKGSGSEMSSAGFFSGVAIDTGADVFSPR